MQSLPAPITVPALGGSGNTRERLSIHILPLCACPPFDNLADKGQYDLIEIDRLGVLIDNQVKTVEGIGGEGEGNHGWLPCGAGRLQLSTHW